MKHYNGNKFTEKDIFHMNQCVDNFDCKASKDLDFGINGFIAKGTKCVVNITDDFVEIDLGRDAFSNPRAERIQRISFKEFVDSFDFDISSL